MAAINKAQSKPAQSHLVPGDDFWTEIVFQIIKDNGIGPIRITSVVNESLKWGKFKGRERVEHKLKMFKIILAACCEPAA